MDEKQFIVFVFVDTNATFIAFKSPDLCVILEKEILVHLDITCKFIYTRLMVQ